MTSRNNKKIIMDNSELTIAGKIFFTFLYIMFVYLVFCFVTFDISWYQEKDAFFSRYLFTILLLPIFKLEKLLVFLGILKE